MRKSAARLNCFVRMCRDSTLLAVLGLLAMGCAHEPLTPAGARVAVTPSASASTAPRRPGCRRRGTIVGVSASACGSGWKSKHILLASALDDLRNKAAAIGADYVEEHTPEFGWSGEFHGTSTSSAAVQGIAYRCGAASTDP